MNRDNLAGFPARRITADASARFTYLAEAIGRAFEPTQTQLDDLERAYNATGDYLSECPEFDGLLTHVHAQGSRPLGTIVRPMDPEREGFDIDLVARLARAALTRYGGDTGAALLLQHLFTALNRYAQRHDLGIERWDRCVTLVYAGGMPTPNWPAGPAGLPLRTPGSQVVWRGPAQVWAPAAVPPDGQGWLDAPQPVSRPPPQQPDRAGVPATGRPDRWVCLPACWPGWVESLLTWSWAGAALHPGCVVDVCQRRVGLPIIGAKTQCVTSKTRFKSIT